MCVYVSVHLCVCTRMDCVIFIPWFTAVNDLLVNLLSIIYNFLI